MKQATSDVPKDFMFLKVGDDGFLEKKEYVQVRNIRRTINPYSYKIKHNNRDIYITEKQFMILNLTESKKTRQEIKEAINFSYSSLDLSIESITRKFNCNSLSEVIKSIDINNFEKINLNS